MYFSECDQMITLKYEGQQFSCTADAFVRLAPDYTPLESYCAARVWTEGGGYRLWRDDRRADPLYSLERLSAYCLNMERYRVILTYTPPQRVTQARIAEEEEPITLDLEELL